MPSTYLERDRRSHDQAMLDRLRSRAADSSDVGWAVRRIEHLERELQRFKDTAVMLDEET